MEFLGRSSNLFVNKPIKKLPAKVGRKRPTETLEKRTVELGRLDYPRVNPGDSFDSLTRTIIGAQIGARLMRPGSWVELGLTAQEARDLATCIVTNLHEQYGDGADRVVEEAFAALGPERADIDIDAECYAKHLLSLPLARRTPKWTARDVLVAVFLGRAADHHAHDRNLLRGLAQEIWSVILDELGGNAATKTDCQRFLEAHADRFGPERCQHVSDLVAELPDGVLASILSTEGESAHVTYRSPLYEISWDKSARRKFSSDLDLTLRICLARDALWYGGHTRPLAFITEQLNKSSRSERHQGWKVQDVQSRLKPFKNQLVPEDEQTWPAFVVRWLEQTDVEMYKRAFEAHCHGREVRFCFRVSGSTGTCRRMRKRTRTSPLGLIVDESEPTVMWCVFDRDWRPLDGTPRLEWIATSIGDWYRGVSDRLTRETSGLS